MTDEKKPVSNKPVQVSNAPPPITPLRGSGRSAFSPKRNNALPDWAKWKYMPEVEAFQACALALNFDPDSMRRSPQSWMVPGVDIFLPESFPSDEVAGKFKNLMEIAKANNLRTIHFKINLPEFAAWCAPVVRDLTGRDIPPELAALAKAATQAAPMVEAVPAAKVETVPVETPSGDDWKVKARAIADRIALEKYDRGEREITARNICDAVATELAKDSTTHGIRGERSAGNIRNLAINGWKFIPPTGTNGTSGTKK